MANFQERINELFAMEQDRNYKTTQEDFAEKLGVTYNQLSGWMNGRSLPRFDTIPRIAKKAGVSSSWILGETEVPTPVDRIKSVEWSEIADYAAGLSPQSRDLLKAFIDYLKALEALPDKRKEP